MYGRTVFVKRSIWTLRIVRLRLELTLYQWNLDTGSKLVNRGCGVLVRRENRVKLVNETFCQWSVLRYAIHYELNCGLLVSKKVNEPGGLYVRT